MSAVASSAGVISATAPGATPVSAPFSDNFNRANGDPGPPWYVPGCGHLPLAISSNTLTGSSGTVQLLGLLLDSDDFDLTFDVHYSASTGAADDVQVYFRRTACWVEAECLLLATNPGAGGTSGVTIYDVVNDASFSVVHFEDHGDVFENTTYTWRLHVVGTACDVYVNGSLYYSTTVAALPGQRGLIFLTDKVGTYIDNVSIA